MINIQEQVLAAFKNKHPIECMVFIESKKQGIGLLKTQSFIQSKGLLSSFKEDWQEVTCANAKSILVDLCSRSVCYGTEIMSVNKANSLVNTFFSNFDELENKYFTNLILEIYPPIINIHKLIGKNGSCSQLLPTSLLSIGVLVVNADQIGLFVRGEWD